MFRTGDGVTSTAPVRSLYQIGGDVRIACVHGAFDHCRDQDSGIEQMADRLRRLGHDVTTHECDADKDSIPNDADGYLVYSNGMDKMNEKLVEQHTRTKILICLDGVWKDFWSRFWQVWFVIPATVGQCVTFRRRSNWLPPRSSPVSRDKTIPVNLGHGEIPKDQNVQDEVVRLFQSVAVAE